MNPEESRDKLQGKQSKHSQSGPRENTQKHAEKIQRIRRKMV